MPSIFVFPSTSLLHITFAVLQKPCQSRKFWEISWIRQELILVVLKKILFFKIPKWQHKLVQNYKQGKLVSYFLNNAAKTCLYGLKISENIEIEHVFQSKTFFHLSSNLHTSYLSTFNSKRET